MTSQLSIGHGISQILSHLTMTAMFHLLPENLHGKGRVMLQQVQVLVVFIPAGDGLSMTQFYENDLVWRARTGQNPNLSRCYVRPTQERHLKFGYRDTLSAKQVCVSSK